ncbi:MAG: imidazole glycerol phosphate synthase subunit HisH [Burkholderiales bacterium]|nr:imidazole glycerol phosphate synthase subunit HisH [Burkholderiales bacterium]
MKVTVVDYGIGNLFSVGRALQACGAEVVFAADTAGVSGAGHLVLPGVGAFAGGMQGLRERGLVEPIRKHALAGRPLLGICLGMQMLATSSEEFGQHEGLDLIPGRVLAMPADHAPPGSGSLKIPAIGWRQLRPGPRGEWQGTPLAGCEPGTSTYFVHSFHVVPDDEAHLLASYAYGGHRITAAIGKGRIFGTQFHPEKSGAAGLKILQAFLQLPAR